MENVFRALSDSTRCAIVEELAARDGQSLFEICTTLITRRGISVSRQAVAKHIAVLSRAGVVDVRWSGRTRIHRLNRGPLHEAQQWLAAHTATATDTTEPEEYR